MLLLLIENASDLEYMDQLITIKRFSLLYNGVSDINPTPGHDINKFVPGQTIAVQFQVYLLNFLMSKDLRVKFGYTF